MPEKIKNNAGRKKAAKNSRKAEKAKKSAKPAPLPRDKRPLICPPDKAGRSPALRFFGLFLRGVIAVFAVFGLALLITDSLALNVSLLGMLGTSVLAVTIFGFIFTSRRGAIGGLCALVGICAIRFIAAGDLIGNSVTAARLFFNAIIDRLTARNFVTLLRFRTDVAVTGEFGEDTLLGWMMGYIIFALALIFVPCIIRRTRVILPAAVSTVLLGLIFTYNLSDSNIGIALVIASFAAIIVLNIYDHQYIRRPDEDLFDTETDIFRDEGRPELPEEEKERLLREAELKKNKKNKKGKKEKNNGRLPKAERVVTVEQEIDSYFDTGRKKTASAKREKVKLTPQQKKEKEAQLREEKLKRRELRRRVREVELYDRRTVSARAAMGGFAGFAAFVVSVILLVIPAIATGDDFARIPGISETMDICREYLTAILQGDDPVLDDLEYARSASNFEPRDTTAKKIEYNGTQYFRLETAAATNLYLQGWIATEYRDGSWYTAGVDSEAYAAYRSLYDDADDYDLESTPSESLYYNFMKVMAPDTVRDRNFEEYDVQNVDGRYGMLMEQVNFYRINQLDTKLYLPTKFSVQYGLRNYGTAEKSELSYANFFDGIYTGRHFDEQGISYAAVVYAAYRSTNHQWMERTVSPLIAEYNEGYADACAVFARNADSVKNHRFDRIRQQLINALFADAEITDGQITHDPAAGTTTQVRTVTVSSGTYTVVTVTESVGGRLRSMVVTAPDGSYSYEMNSLGEVTRSGSGTLPLAVRYHTLMSADDREALALAYYEQYIYADFVYATYTGKAESAVISEVYNTILDLDYTDETIIVGENGENTVVTGESYKKDFTGAADRVSTDAQAYNRRHELVMAVIDYITDPENGYTYTLDPTATPDPALDGVENFLTVTKEGYCVQFASAAVLLLREAGIPARYVEGFIATDYTRQQTDDVEGRYIAIVRDENAHAWLEVWFDGIGWVQYEATPEFYDDMYGSRNPGEVIPDDEPSHFDPSEYEEQEQEQIPPVDEEALQQLLLEQAERERIQRIRRTIIISVCIALVVIPLTLFVVIRVRKVRAAERRKAGLIAEAVGMRIPRERRRETAREIIDMMNALFSAYGTPPAKGEFRGEYAERMQREYLDIFGKTVRNDEFDENGNPTTEVFSVVSDTDFSELFDAVAAEEFGTEGMTDAQIRDLAAFVRRLSTGIQLRMKLFPRIKYKYLS